VKRLLVFLAVCACSSSRRAPPTQPPPEPPADAEPEPAVQRPLTERERGVLAPLFAASLDLDVIHVVQDKYVPFQGDDTYMTPENDVYAPGALYLADFFAPEIEPYTASTLVHEVTHAWQHQSGLDLIAAGAITFAATGGNYEEAYPYRLDTAKDLTEYNVEQQASIVEDWYLITTRQYAPYSLVIDDPANPDWPTIWAGYRAVLAKFLEDPGYARLLTPDVLLKRHADAIK
jgi:hypothetical protein